ncbi:MAG: hypothetical protein KDI37_00200 [Xanthomonadales bacterium]|nr:hypothetical protein [Xanthomonadales bacterium]
MSATCIRAARKLGIVLALAWTLGSVAHGAEAYLASYTAYQQAFQKGDVQSALRHGEAAWREAEAAVGDDQITAVLAYNYARLAFVYPASAESAVEAYRRALALTESGVADLNPVELKTAIAEVELFLNPDEPRFRQRLATQLQHRQTDESAPSDVSAHAWRSLARAQLNAGSMLDAAASADRAASEASQLAVPDLSLERDALVLAGLARLSTSRNKRTRELIEEALAQLDRAIPMFPPQRDIDSFDRGYALAILLRTAIDAMADSHGYRASGLPTFEVPLRIDDGVDRTHCPATDGWIKRSPVVFPAEGQTRGQVSAVLLGIDFGETEVERVVVLAEPQSGGFGKAASDSVKRWTIAAGIPAECRTNLLQLVQFSLR